MKRAGLTPLEILIAEREIYQTHFRFFRLADSYEYERLAETCFTPDAYIEYTIMPGPPQRFHGREEFATFMLAGGRRPGAAVAHVAGQSSIDWSSGHPHLSGYATVWHWAATRNLRGEHRPADWTTIGRIEDDYEFLEDRWLISRRRISPAAGLVATGAAPGLGRPTGR
ncbi:nuclear transport factor 2 family protein [Dactylosporangium sp. NPDC051485]|uniref:nuclear transport factor 2 family protein n=1 Tax=Dactylosporangium sp. NPDC051485 TaxID=3154846 RepID=UPI003416D0D4